MAYSKTNWNNNTAPYLNAGNLNKIEGGIYDNSISAKTNANDIDNNTEAIENNSQAIEDNETNIQINADNILGLSVGEIYQGTWTPEAGTEYPSSPQGGWSYYISGLTEDGYFFTSGDLNGRTANNSDKMIYNGTSWSMIDNTNEMLGYYMVDDMESMLSLSPLQGALCIVYGYDTANDGGGGSFNYDASLVGTNNGGTILNGWVRQYNGSITPRWFGAKGDGATDDVLAIQAAIDEAGSIGGYRNGVNLEGLAYKISQTLTTEDSYDVKIENGILLPTDTLIAGSPAIHINANTGNIEVSDIFIDGRDSSLNMIMNGILSDLGSNTFSYVEGRGFPDYGIKVTGGTNVRVMSCTLNQWTINDVENGISANRTAKLYWMQTGDVYVSDCVGAYCDYPVYSEGVGQHYMGCHFYNGATSGDVVTANRPYNAFVGQGSSPKFRDCYFDRGTILMNTVYAAFTGCTFLCDDSRAFDPLMFEFAPLEPLLVFDGLTITNSSITGSLNGGANPLTRDNMFQVNTTNGDFALGKSSNVFVESNTYHRGTATGAYVPSTSGTIRMSIDQATWVLDTGEYKSGNIDLSDYVFLDNYLLTNFTMGVEGKNAKPYSSSYVWMQKSTADGYQIQFWSSEAHDVNLHVSWTSSANTLVQL